MLETYFVKPQTVERITASWIGSEVERCPAGQRGSGYFGGMPHEANLGVGRNPSELAGLALIVMWTDSVTHERHPVRNGVSRPRRPHNEAGHRTQIMWRVT